MNKTFRMAASAAILSLLVGHVAAAQAPAAPKLKDQMRMPWQRGGVDYIRTWTVSGPHKCDLARDCLDIPGGEAAAAFGASQIRGDGSALTWNPQTSWGDFISFDAVPAPKDGAVAYAFATIERATAGPARLSIGSADGVRVFVNGKLVWSRDGHRAMTPDEDQVDVTLARGTNTLLIKAGARSTFTARVLEAGAEPRRSAEIGPSVIEQQPNVFTVRTDVGTARAAAEPVKIEVIAPGGAVKFTGSGTRGELVPVGGVNEWPDGPYEVRASTRTATGLLYVTHLPFFKGNALAVARALAAEAAQADGRTPEGATLQMLAEMVDDRLGVKLADATGNPWPKIHSPLMEYQELMLERQGKPGRVRAGGFVRIAYVHDIDGSVQFARAWLPASYDPARQWPLLLQLHGFNGANPRYVGWWSVDSRHPNIDTEFAGHEQVILIEPHGRGNTQYYGMGDDDIMRVLAEARRLFSVDADRVYLSGESMGGFGTWNVGTRHPDVFAALAPVFGGFDYHAELSEEKLGALTPVDRYLNERQSSWAMAENLLHVPVFVHHGDLDGAVKVDWSRWGVKLLQRFGYDVRYQEYPGRIHETLRTGTSDANMNIPWFLAHRRESQPRTVRMRSAELRHASAYWVSVEQAESPLAFMEVDAEVVDRNVIRLDTDNVLAVVLKPAALVDAARPVRVVWNGVAHELPLADGVLRLARADYLSPSASSPAAPRKTPRLPGGIGDFLATPFAVVVGTTSKDPQMRALCAQKAQDFVDVWRDWQKHEPRVFRDTEISAADIGRYSLLLIGGPADNRVAAALASKLPLRLSRDAISIGGHEFRARDATVQFLYPNPRNPERYVWVLAGNSADGMFYADATPYALPEWDYLIADGRMPAYGQSASATQTRVVSGSFDHDWRYAAAFAVEGDAAVRGKANRLSRPRADAPVDTKRLDEYVGRYQVGMGPQLDVSRDGTRLVSGARGNHANMIPQGGESYYLPEFKVWITFVRDAAGKVTGFSGTSTGGDIDARRLP